MKLNHQVRRWSLMVGLALGVVAAHAQDGFRVDTYQQSLVKAGMSKSEVQQAIGRPSRDANYGVASGSTWVYGIKGQVNNGLLESSVSVYEVDFGTDGKVISARERTLSNADRGTTMGY